MTEKRKMLEATADSVGSAIELLWNWLSAPEPKPGEKEPSILDLLPDSVEEEPPKRVDGRIPPVVVDKRPEETGPIDTTGEEV